MSHLLDPGGLLGAGGSEFEFGAELAEDEPPADYIYDTVNEETFGTEVESGGEFEMDTYAEQTANLDGAAVPRAEEEQLKQHQLWVETMLEANVSNLLSEDMSPVSAPSADQLPLPNMFSSATNSQGNFKSMMGGYSPGGSQPARQRLEHIFGNSTKESSSQNQHSTGLFSLDIGTVDTIWGQRPEATTIRDEKQQEKESTEANNNPLLQLLKQMNLQNHQQKQPIDQHPPRMMSVEELEKRQQQSQLSKMMNVSELEQAMAMNQQLPPMLTLQELERRMGIQQQQQQRSMSPPHQQQMRFPQMPPPWLNPQVRAAIVAHLAAGKPLPPGFPPPAFFMRPGMMLPGQRPPMPRPPNFANSGPMRMPPPKSGDWFRPRQKRVNLPSEKTISDLALDPYAGLMSCKEREWLVKIQGLQLQGSGNPYNDDYYYTMWKEQQSGRNPYRYRINSTDQATEPYNYVPPTFAGSLGKPTLSTANYPRQLIDLRQQRANSEATEGCSSASSSRPTTPLQSLLPQQPANKRLKKVLIEVENAWVWMLELEEKKRTIATDDSLTLEQRFDLSADSSDRLSRLFSVFDDGKLVTICSLRKGRQLLARLLKQLDSNRSTSLLAVMTRHLGTLGKKDAIAEMHITLFAAIRDSLNGLNDHQLTEVWQEVTVDIMTQAIGSGYLFPQSFLLLLVSISSDRHLNCANLPLAEWLRLASNSPKKLTRIPWISSEQLIEMRHWLCDMYRLEKHTVDGLLSAIST